MLFGIAITFARLNKSDEADAKLEEMWDACKKHNPRWGRYFRHRTVLAIPSIKGKLGRFIAISCYRIANKVVKFN